MNRPLSFALRAGPHNPRICPQPHLTSGVPSLREAALTVAADFELPHGRDALRSLARSAPMLAAGVVVLLAIALQLVKDRSDVSEIELVMLETPDLELAAEPEVVPEPEPLLEPEPLPEPEPVVQVAVVQQIPAPAVPEPVAQEIVPVREPPPPIREAPPVRPKPQILAQAIATPKPAPPPRVQRAPERVVRPAAPATRPPPVEFAAAPKLDQAKPALPTRAETTRPFRPVAAKIAPAVAPLAPARSLVDAAAPSPRPSRASRALPIRRSRDRSPAPVAVAMAEPNPLTLEASREPVRRVARTPDRRSSAPARPDVRVAVPAAPSSQRKTERAAAPTRIAARAAPRANARPESRKTILSLAPTAVNSLVPKPVRKNQGARALVRAAVPAASPSRAAASSSDERPSGVPLGSLASCVSDREETALKQVLLSSVKTQKECISDAGHYRFLQTKNLNAFLMWVDPAPTRVAADRCIELAHALDCVKRHNTTESRNR